MMKRRHSENMSRNVKNKIYPIVENQNDSENATATNLRDIIKTGLHISHSNERDSIHSEVTIRLSNLSNFSQDEQWPKIMDDSTAIETGSLRPLASTNTEISNQVMQRGKILVRSITWNQHAEAFPDNESLRKYLLPNNYYHVIAIGTQECENSITKSLLYPSKEKWEKLCGDVLGMDYEFVRGHSLQASHLAVFVHKAVIQLVSNGNSHAVATGFCDTLGNKGGIGISLHIGKTSFCFLTAHLAAHQKQMDRRIVEFARISKEVASMLHDGNKIPPDDSTNIKQESVPFIHEISSSFESESADDNGENDAFYDDGSESIPRNSIGSMTSALYKGLTTSFRSSCCATSICKCSKCSTVRHTNTMNPLTKVFDHVIWGGDLNFRIHGSRDIVEALLQHNRYTALKDNDQLSLLLQFDKAFAGFEEGPLTFYPTYKFDKNSDVYDTSSKRRVPAWTDRILYSTSPSLKLLSYASINEIKNSDHRPVYASFECGISLEESHASSKSSFIRSVFLRSESKRNLCAIS